MPSANYFNTSIDNVCQFIQLEREHELIFNKQDVQVLNLESKSQLLGHNISKESRDFGSILLENLHQSSLELDNKLVLKVTDLDHLVFRLVIKRTSNIAVDRSYIALSYHWTKPIHDGGHDSNDALLIPTSTAMFQAVLNERQSTDEGIWFDQVCINQKDGKEKAVSIGAMDIIYRSARSVVIALDDVTIGEDEERFLREYFGLDNIYEYSGTFSLHSFKCDIRENAQRYSKYTDDHPIVFEILQKILNSTYFDRAWCNHEMRLGQDLVFLAHCTGCGAFGETRFLRMTSMFLYVLWSLALLGDSEISLMLHGIRPGLFSMLEKKVRFDNTQLQLGSPLLPRLQSLDLLSILTDIWTLEARGDPLLTSELRDGDANLDRVSIVLNVSGYGISLGPRTAADLSRASRGECEQLLWAVVGAASKTSISVLNSRFDQGRQQ
jgi:Heterokaryon incompatibility protein (HET)